MTTKPSIVVINVVFSPVRIIGQKSYNFMPTDVIYGLCEGLWFSLASRTICQIETSVLVARSGTEPNLSFPPESKQLYYKMVFCQGLRLCSMPQGFILETILFLIGNTL